ncbi:hypothetical protein [Pontibacter kalidii]|uniref:hypothetical protein n=1 Tax=Pontibacter kalidii TaxID=2592049 RepID=UPI00225B817B|nr:hypothetical protein [Pontibacter kalidii]
MSKSRKQRLGKYSQSIKAWLTRIRKSAAAVVPDKDVRNSKYKSIAKASMAFQASWVANPTNKKTRAESPRQRKYGYLGSIKYS